MSAPSIETIVNLSKRRGFVFPASEIYGGLSSAWDFGPLGVELANNIKNAWWRWLVHERDDIEGIDTCIIQNRLVWKYSGHEATFNDPLVDCRTCKGRFRYDKLHEYHCPRESSTCVGKGKECDLTEPRQFNLMFKTTVGAVSAEDDPSALVYLRPETAQGIFINFKNVLDTTRRKLPFGIAQIGKSFRNEVTPGNFIFRTREFEQMEMEYFCHPKDAAKIHQEWIDAFLQWFKDLGISEKNLKLHEQTPDELAHYAVRCVDILYRFFPERPDEKAQFDELMGIANRTDYDLRQHSKKAVDEHGNRINPDSTEDLSYFDPVTQERFYPYCIEPAAGVNRTVLAVMMDAYSEKMSERGEKRVILKLKASLAPIKVAVLPLAKNKPEIVSMAKAIKKDLMKDFRTVYDDTAGIGKLYARQDEIGTPFCVTVDHQSLEDNAVTVRDRDTWEQDRINVSQLGEYLRKRLKEK
ncbi:MAG: glycine--tRNA ligase [Acidobacteria bacterium]|jgi:glycyl-tRNA synthetase|nr:MAG: glycine--tRNA ligase [Acidobacteriota bacterium]GIU80970.1 MAG: glycine--tRNA ligase [Pyrinomonadaceae bacterium]